MVRGTKLDRRDFLKLGAAGTALAASHPLQVLSAKPGSKSLNCPPALADLASDPSTYHFGDLFNCPAAMNEWGYAQVGKSVSAISAISFPPYACCGVAETAWSPGFLLTCELFLNGQFLAIAAPPDGNVQYQWFPHRVLRTQVADHLRFTTTMFLPSKRRAVVQRITVENLRRERRKFTLSFDTAAVSPGKRRHGSPTRRERPITTLNGTRSTAA